METVESYSKIWKRFSYPLLIADLAARRIRGLMHSSVLQTTTIEKLLQSAYLQGICDAAECVVHVPTERT